jgi:hypothetical protein
VLTRCAPDDIRLVDLSVPNYEPRGAIDVDLMCGAERVQVIATQVLGR